MSYPRLIKGLKYYPDIIYNGYLRKVLEVYEGEGLDFAICDPYYKRYDCKKCKGKGKLDWIQKVMGVKE